MTTQLTGTPAKTLYGPAGWTRAIGAASLLLPGRIEATPSFARFDHLQADHARILLDRMPHAALADRQNEAPSVGHLLKAAIAHPDEIELAGYLIGPTRADERISLDMMAMRSPWSHFARTGDSEIDSFAKMPDFWLNLPYHCTRSQLWSRVVEYLDLGECGEPDEIEFFTPLTGTLGGWWMWWD
ncbi:hypothetical protein H8R18_04720 [Nanchangia anserum]|uniref:Uncharacterized protein n=1 Tax=Nanchangia anserum TaxID=2692125 RepID=A0A8I0GBA2_9ACTO|nr:hypothetical protein [Nanchangia anserum]MBD3688856.1 hypothetical protein [Nanchangia anserum]QOX81128.1 hypothetical protein H8R18_04720 [Nanchangia anserum]